MGGGMEVIDLLLITFMFGRRPKFFYYLACFTIEKSLGGFMKMIYHKPRPYMAVPQIMALTCSKELGNPSGHSSTSWYFFIMLALDIYHGNDETFRQIEQEKQPEKRDQRINSHSNC